MSALDGQARPRPPPCNLADMTHSIRKLSGAAAVFGLAASLSAQPPAEPAAGRLVLANANLVNVRDGRV
jgi:hypothetical protein